MRRRVLALFALISGSVSASAQVFTPEEISRRTVERRAVEAVIWGMPAVSMAAFRASLKRDLDADFGDVIYFSNVMEPRHEFLTANNQTPYVFTFFDLRRGPWCWTFRRRPTRPRSSAAGSTRGKFLLSTSARLV
jgi:hypothetical protein